MNDIQQLSHQISNAGYAMSAVAFGLVCVAIAIAYLTVQMGRQIGEYEDDDGDDDGDDDPDGDKLPVFPVREVAAEIIAEHRLAERERQKSRAA